MRIGWIGTIQAIGTLLLLLLPHTMQRQPTSPPQGDDGGENDIEDNVSTNTHTNDTRRALS